MTVNETDIEVGKEFVEHFGTKGMRWGVRRSRDELARGSGKKSDDKTPTKPKTVVGKTKTEGKSSATLSDKNLQKVINRLNMEQQYAKLTAPPPTRTQKLLRSAAKFGGEAARQVAMKQVVGLGNEMAAKKVGALMTTKNNAKIAKNLADLAGRKSMSFT